MHLVHFGTFDVENYGDLLFPLIARHRLSAADIDISFVSPVGGPPVWKGGVATIPPVGVDDLDIDGVLLGGGNIVHAGPAGVDAYRADGLSALLAYTRLWLQPSEIAHARGVPLCWNAPGIPRAMTRRAGEVLRWAAKQASYLSVRDAQSLRNLRQAGVSGSAQVVPDTALEVNTLWSEAALLDARESLFSEAGRPVPARTVAVHLNERYIVDRAAKLADRLDRIAERAEATPVLLALGPCHGDGDVVRDVGARMKSDPLVVDRPRSLRQLVAAIAGSEAYLGSSMHGLITAASFGRPGIVVAREPEGVGKFSGLLEQFELERWLMQSWADAEDGVDEVLEQGPADFARVGHTAKPALDEHWTRISEALLEAKPRRRAGSKSSGPPSVDAIVEEGIGDLVSVVARERRSAAAHSARAERYRERLVERDAELEAAAERRVEADARLAELDLALTAAVERAHHAEQRMLEIEGERDEAARELDGAKSARAERELELQRRMTELETANAEAARRLETAGSELERRSADVRAITELLAQREETFRAALEAQQEAARTVAHLERGLAEAHAREAEAQAAASKLAASESQLADIRVELEAARRRMAERDAIVSRLSDAIERANSEHEATLSRLELAETEAVEAERLGDELETEVERLATELADMRQLAARLETVEQEAADLRVELSEARDQLRSTEQEIADQQHRTEALEAELREREQRALQRTESLEAELREREHHQQRAEVLEAELREREQAASELRAEFESEGAQRRSVERLYKESLERERTLRDRLVLERDSLEERLEATLTALNEARTASPDDASIEALAAERNRLNAELLTERAAREGLEEHVASLRKEIEHRTRVVFPADGDDAWSPKPPARDLPVSVVPDDPEAAARAEFSDRYDELCHRSGLAHLEPAARALPWPVFPPPPESDWHPLATIVVCVHNALDDVRRCLESVARHLTVDAEILIVDDGSDELTADVLEAIAAGRPRVRLISNPDPPHGYTVAANLGLRAAAGEYIVLLNSDTIVTAGWLERIIECAEADAAIGIVGPVSNAASHQSVPKIRDAGAWATNPLPGWLTVEGMGVAVAGASARDRPRVTFINGFCYAITRRTLDAVGFLDEENFASGYCEENDFSLRARKAGFMAAIADDAYVFHAKSRSYKPEGRNEHAKRNYARFLEKHGVETIRPLVDALEASPPVADLGSRLDGLLRDPVELVRVVQEHLPVPVRPMFVLPGIAEGGSGGSHSIVQETVGMRQLGIRARIAIPEKALERVRNTYANDLDLFAPYKGDQIRAEVVDDATVVIATHSDSVPLVAEMLKQRSDVLPAYYVQDYEPFFWPEGSESTRRALASYTSLADACLFAKTHWICNVVSAAHGIPMHKVEPSIDRLIYRPPETDPSESEPVVVAAMVRPRTPRRQPRATVSLLERLARTFGERVEIVTFGCPQEAFDKLTDVPALRQAHRGLLSRSDVAEVLRGADVFVDHSVYQAFGRTALEAMACACVPVVPSAGGAWEFAEPGVNAMVCDTNDGAAVYFGVAQLIEDAALRQGLRETGLGTASRYSVERAALSEFAVFASALLSRSRTGSAQGFAARVG